MRNEHGSPVIPWYGDFVSTGTFFSTLRKRKKRKPVTLIPITLILILITQILITLIPITLLRFLKNLKFFEAFLLLILIYWGLNLYQIGLLSSVIYGVAYLVEIPAGAIADNFGLKRVLLTAFVMYIVSFLFYAGAGIMKTQVHRIVALVIASAFYGLGEAFRSGVHKAMILRFLDKHGLIKHKAFIYSQTRSYSNLGSALNALGSIGLVIVLKSNYKMFFLVSAIPFVLDFMMVSTYPSYMNETPLEKKNKTMGAIMSDTKTALFSLLSETRSRCTVLSTSSFMALFLTLKHYVQPVVALYGGSILENYGVSNPKGEAKKILLGALYCVFYLLSAFATKHSWRLKAYFASPKQAMDVMYDIYLIVIILIGVFLWKNIVIAVLPLYLIVFVLQNLWKPHGMSGVSDLLGKNRRALVLSSDSLMKTVMQFFLAPGVGRVSDQYGLDAAFIGFGVAFFVLNHLFMFGSWSDEDENKTVDGEKNKDDDESKRLLSKA